MCECTLSRCAYVMHGLFFPSCTQQQQSLSGSCFLRGLNATRAAAAVVANVTHTHTHIGKCFAHFLHIKPSRKTLIHMSPRLPAATAASAAAPTPCWQKRRRVENEWEGWLCRFSVCRLFVCVFRRVSRGLSFLPVSLLRVCTFVGVVNMPNLYIVNIIY